ncbi:MAG: hypothetical protein ABIS51_15255 [Sphingomonas sp.]
MSIIGKLLYRALLLRPVARLSASLSPGRYRRVKVVKDISGIWFGFRSSQRFVSERGGASRRHDGLGPGISEAAHQSIKVASVAAVSTRCDREARDNAQA